MASCCTGVSGEAGTLASSKEVEARNLSVGLAYVSMIPFVHNALSMASEHSDSRSNVCFSTGSSEFKGNQTGTTYALDETYQSSVTCHINLI